MDHLTYQETRNKNFSDYQKKFKKMIKEKLPEKSAGGGEFLLVKDFPFKDGDNYMFTAGDNIGKWKDKSLDSLFGKKKYILGKCYKRNKGEITLVEFSKGDLVKDISESGLRKDLKAFFEGSGVKVRTFKSAKIGDVIPEEELEDNAPIVDVEIELPEFENEKEKQDYLAKVYKESPIQAEKLGLDKDQEYVTTFRNFHRKLMSRSFDDALPLAQKIQEMLGKVKLGKEEEGKVTVKSGELATTLALKVNTDVFDGESLDKMKEAPPDPFGILKSPSQTFLNDFDYSTLPVNKYAGFLNKLSMVSMTDAPDFPNPEEVGNDNLYGGGEGQIDTVTEGIPHIVHAIWLGGPLMGEDFRKNFAKAKSKYPGWAFNLWNNVPRKVMKDAQGGAEGVLMDKVRDFMGWARKSGVNIINVDEVFGGNNSMELEVFYKTEENQRIGVGYAGCSDILRIEILKRFGGVYLEGDNNLGGNLVDMLTKTHEDGGFKAANMDGRMNNSSFVTTPGHPNIFYLLNKMRKNYTLTQEEVNGAKRARAARFEVMKRTGPGALTDMMEEHGYDRYDEKLLIDQGDIIVDSASSWYSNATMVGLGDPDTFVNNPLETLANAKLRLQGELDNIASPPEPGDKNLTQTELDEMNDSLQKAITLMLFEMKNHPGMLDLDAVNRHLKGLAAPDLALTTFLEMLSANQFNAVRNKFTSIRFPKTGVITKGQLDLIFDKGKFNNIDVSKQGLQEAALNGNNYILKYLIGKGLLTIDNMDSVNEDFIEAGFDSSKNASRGGMKNILFFAIEAGDEKTLMQLMKLDGFNNWLKELESGQHHPLNQAIYKKQFKIAAWLIEAGAKVDGDEAPFTNLPGVMKDNPDKMWSVLSKLLTAAGGKASRAVNAKDRYKNTLASQMCLQGMFDALASLGQNYPIQWFESKKHPITIAVEQVERDPKGIPALINAAAILNQSDVLRVEALGLNADKLLSAIFNRERDPEQVVDPGSLDEGAVMAIVISQFTDEKKVKAMLKDYDTGGLQSTSEFKRYCYKALAYAMYHKGELSVGKDKRATRRHRDRWVNGLGTLDFEADDSKKALKPLRDFAVKKLGEVRT